MKISERLKKEHPEVTDCKILYRGDGTVILDVKKNKTGVKNALTADEMRTFYALMRISEDSANDFMYVKLLELVKKIETMTDTEKYIRKVVEEDEEEFDDEI